MIIRQLAILILVGAASSASAQQACKPIRLDVGAGPLARTTMIDQSALGLCQFATTAYLVEAETARLNGAAASPISYIQLFTEYIDRYGLDGPYEPKNIASAARQAGGCPPAAVSALVTADASLCVDEKRVAASLMGDQGRVIGPTCPARDNATPDDDQQFAYSRAVLKVVVGANSAAAPDLVKRVRTACDGARTDLSRLPEIERLSAYQLAEAERAPRLQQVLDGNLDSQVPRPIGVRYCADVLEDRSTTGVDVRSGKIYMSLCKSTGWHASAVIGRRQGPRGCQYLIMNTWGASCNRGYDKRNECEGGKLWVDANDLLRNTTGLFWFK